MENSTKKFTIPYNSKAGNRFILQKTDKQLIFNSNPYGFYFHDVRYWEILMLDTTTGNCEGYTDHDFAEATKAREGLAMMGNPSPMDYINIVYSGMLRNFPVTPEAFNNANTVFVPDVASLKGKTTKKNF